MESFKWLCGYLKRHKIRIGVVFLLSALFIVLAFAYPLFLGRFVDDVITCGKTDMLIFYVSLLFSIIVIKEITGYVRQITLEHISQNVVKDIRNKLYNKLQTLDSYFYQKERAGDLMSRLTMDTDAIRLIVDSTMPEFLNQFLFIIIGIGVLIAVSPVIGLSLLTVAPFIFWAAYGMSKYGKPTFVHRREANAELNTVVRENIEGNRVVKAYAREEFEIDKFEKKNQKYKDTFMEFVRVWIKYGPALIFFRLMIIVIFILVGGLFVIKGTVQIGEFVTVNGCLWCITSPMSMLGNFINQYQQFVASCNKIRELEDREPRIKNRNVKKRDTGIQGKIEFKNVTFAYEGERVLRNVNFTANPGDTIALVGPTGSGKTTVINLLSRFYDPDYGTVYIDDVNIKNIDLDTLRKNITSAMQDVFLFSDTIRNNIAYGTPSATDEDIERVARLANAHEFIQKMDDGYDTMVGERGTGLSGGQRQRISLARALLKNPPILVLDDTTSALDMETEYSIQENLKQSRTTKIIIAHRISSVKNADLILVLNHGKLIEWGNHETLMSQDGYYKGVFEHQFGDFNHTGENGGEANG